MHGKTGITWIWGYKEKSCQFSFSGVIWCLLHPQSFTLTQYAECLKCNEVGFKSELSVRKCNMKILQSMFFLLTHIQVNMLFITGLMCKQIFKCKTIYAVIKTKKYFNLSLNIKFFQSVHFLICSLFVCISMETPHSPVQEFLL